MHPPSRTLLLLHDRAPFVERVRTAASGLFHLRLASSWSSLTTLLGQAGPGSLVLADPYHGGGSRGKLAPALRTLRHSFPSAVVLAALSYRERGYRDMWALSTLGVSDVLVLEEEGTPTGIRQFLLEAQRRSARRLVEGLRLPEGGRGWALLHAAAEVAAAGGQGRDLARALSVSRATLLRWCERFRMPPPRRLLLWSRLLQAASLLDDPGHTVLSVARACGYSSDNALRNALQAVGCPSPRELRQVGALRTVRARFQEEVDGYAVGRPPAGPTPAAPARERRPATPRRGSRV